MSIDREIDDEENLFNIVDTGSILSNLIRKQKNKEISRMVHRLKPHYRELIILRYLMSFLTQKSPISWICL